MWDTSLHVMPAKPIVKLRSWPGGMSHKRHCFWHLRQSLKELAEKSKLFSSMSLRETFIAAKALAFSALLAQSGTTKLSSTPFALFVHFMLMSEKRCFGWCRASMSKMTSCAVAFKSHASTICKASGPPALPLVPMRPRSSAACSV